MSAAGQADARPATRERLLAAARTLFQARGFHGVGVSDILAAAGAPKGSLYHHFPGGKDDLAAVAVAGIAADVAAYIAERSEAGASGADIVAAIADMCAQRMAAEAFAWSPLISAMAAQAGPETPRLAAALALAYAGWRSNLAAAFVRDGLPPARAAEAAGLAVLSLEGAVIVARAQCDGGCLAGVAPLIARFAAG